MPIQIPSSLPAMDVLESENIFVMTQRACHTSGHTSFKNYYFKSYAH